LFSANPTLHPSLNPNPALKPLFFSLSLSLPNSAKSQGSAATQPPQPPATVTTETEPKPLQAKLSKVREGREMLIKYLREMNFTDDVIHVQGMRMKALLDDWPPMVTVPAPYLRLEKYFSSGYNNPQFPYPTAEQHIVVVVQAVAIIHIHMALKN